MATIQLSNPTATGVVSPRQYVVVKVRCEWGDEWRTAKYLEALECSNGAAPTVPTARLRWRSGSIKREDATAFANFTPLEFRGWFVRIEALSPGNGPAVLFTGRICDDEEVNSGSARGVTRDQELTAFGLAHELDRECVFGSWITNDNEEAEQIGISLTFNERFIRGLNELGNRSALRVSGTIDGLQRTAFAFSDSMTAGFSSYTWSARAIAEYLLAWYRPKGQQWLLSGQLDALEKLEPPRFNPNGMSVWQALNEIIDRRRGLGFTVECEGDTPHIYVFTTVGLEVRFDEASLPANNRQFNLNLDVDHQVDPPSVRVDSCAAYDWIHIVGEPVVACFTVSHEDGTLIKGWTDAKETAYKEAADADGRRNDDERSTDKFEQVFANFLIPSTWNWEAGDGQTQKTGSSPQPVHVQPSEEGKLIAGSPVTATVRKWGHTLMNLLPLQKDQRDVPSNRDFNPEYRQPFVLLFDENLQTYRYADNPSLSDDVPASLRILSHEFGFQLDCRPNHLLAYNHWSGANESLTQPKFDWQKMIATVAVRQDCPLAVIRKVTPTRGNGRRVLVINVPNAELWHIVKGTVLEVEKGALKRQERAEVLRDDSARLRQVAAVALAWYGDDHAVLNCLYKRLAPFIVGSFLRTATDASGPRAINSVVSSVWHDLVNQTTTLQTNYGELDFAAAGEAGRGYRSIR